MIRGSALALAQPLLGRPELWWQSVLTVVIVYLSMPGYLDSDSCCRRRACQEGGSDGTWGPSGLQCLPGVEAPREPGVCPALLFLPPSDT